MNGYFNIMKPSGMSSAAAVAVMRRLSGENARVTPAHWIRKPQAFSLL